MDLSEFSTPTYIPPNGGMVEYGGARSQVAIFYLRPVHSPAKSREQGRPVYEDKVYVRVSPPGERLNIIDRPATHQDRAVWPQQYQQFMSQQEQRPDGTPIEMLYPDKPSVVAMLKANNVLTIEQCAELSSDAINTIGMGSQGYVNDAVRYVEVASKGVSASQMRRELEERDSEIRTLRQQVDALKAEVAKLTTPGRGAMGMPALTPEMMSAVQLMVAQMVGQPAVPPSVPGIPVAAAFDAQTAMINANSPTTQEVSRRPTGKARPATLPKAPALEKGSLG